MFEIRQESMTLGSVHKFVKNINEFKEAIKYYKNFHNISLIVIPQFELLPYANLVMNEFDKEKPKIVLLYFSYKENIINYFSTQKNIICCFMNHGIDNCNVFKQINSNNNKIDTLIYHNFASVCKYSFDFFSKDNNLKSSNCNIICYSDGSRNNYKAESKDQLQLDFHTKLNNDKIPNTLYFFGFIDNSYNKDNNNYLHFFYNYKILKYNENVYPKLKPNNFKISQDMGIILMRYLGTKGSPYIFNKNVNIEKIILQQINKIFDNTTKNYIKFDSRFPKELNKSILTNYYEDFSNMFRYSTDLLETILLNNIDYVSKIKKIYSFDSSFPLLFQIPKLYDNLNKEVIIYVGFNNEIFKPVATQECIDTLTSRTIKMILHINELNLFDIYFKDNLVNKDTLKKIKEYDDFLFILKKNK